MIKAGEHVVGQPFTLTCKGCGKAFESKHSNTLFCGPNCRAKFYIREAAKERSHECVCGNCGTTFITTGKDVKYCSAACRTEANLIRQRRRNAESRERLKHEKEEATA